MCTYLNTDNKKRHPLIESQMQFQCSSTINLGPKLWTFEQLLKKYTIFKNSVFIIEFSQPSYNKANYI